MSKVVLVVNGKETKVGDFDTLQRVLVAGSTGQAQYRLDPLQDSLVKIVVDGEEGVVDRDREAVEAAAKK